MYDANLLYDEQFMKKRLFFEHGKMCFFGPKVKFMGPSNIRNRNLVSKFGGLNKPAYILCEERLQILKPVINNHFIRNIKEKLYIILSSISCFGTNITFHVICRYL